MRRTILIGALLLSGCAQGFNRTQLHDQLSLGAAQGQPGYQVAVNNQIGRVEADDIKAALALKPQLHFPFKLAIRLVGPNHSKNWRWTEKDKERFDAWGESLRKRGIVSDVFLLSDLVVDDGDPLPQARLAAAKHGADAVLLIKAAADEDTYVNPASLLYLTLVGYYFSPGSHADGLMVLRGAMYDVGNEYLYLTTEAEGEEKTWGPGAFVSAKDAIEKAKTKALKNFGEELVERISSMK